MKRFLHFVLTPVVIAFTLLGAFSLFVVVVLLGLFGYPIRRFKQVLNYALSVLGADY